MRLGALRIAVMAAKRLLNFVDRGNALSVRLPIPEHDKTLATNATIGFCVSVCSLAKYLHFDLIRAGTVPATHATIGARVPR
jgi:hypothetical protein